MELASKQEGGKMPSSFTSTVQKVETPNKKSSGV